MTIAGIVRSAIKPLIVMAIILLFVEMVLSNEMTGLGREVSSLDKTIYAIRDENQVLTQKIASASSLMAIREKAAAMGFTEAKTVVSMGKDQFSVAFKQTK